MTKSKELELCSQEQQPEADLSVEQTLRLYSGWEAAKAGHPLAMVEGRYFVEGWLKFHLLKGDPRRSWLRH